MSTFSDVCGFSRKKQKQRFEKVTNLTKKEKTIFSVLMIHFKGLVSMS